MTEIEYLLTVKHKKILFKSLIQIASSYSPSSSFKRAYQLAYLNVDKFKALGIAKATRKLAIVKRDKGQNAFDNTIKQLSSSSIRPSSPIPSSPTHAPSTSSFPKNTSVPSQSVLQQKSSPSSLFKFGTYGWLGDYRTQTICNYTDQSFQNSSLPLDIFHSCYLFNTKLTRDITEEEAQVLQPIIDDAGLRKLTISNDLLSRVFAIKYLREVEKEVQKEVEKEVQKEESDEGKDGDRAQKDNGKDRFKKAFKKAKKETEGTEKLIRLFGKLAGKETEELFYGDIAVNPNINIEVLLKEIKSLEITLKSSTDTTFDTGIVDGVVMGNNINSLLPSELSDDDDLFYYKFATKQLLQYDKKAQKKIEPVLILMDKSGSMSEKQKMTASRTVALLIAKKALREGSDCFLQFFDNHVHPEESISLRESKEHFLKELLSMQNSGGTSIQYALETIKNKELRKVVLITDGEDSVNQNAKPPFELISIFTEGWNNDLDKISDKSFKINNLNEIIKS